MEDNLDKPSIGYAPTSLTGSHIGGCCEEGLLQLDGGDDLVDVLLNASEENNIGKSFPRQLLEERLFH